MNYLLEQFKGKLSSSSYEVELLSNVDPNKLPLHIAIIMDGNGRWAKKRNLPRVVGHQSGVESVRIVVETAARLSIPVLTLYAFSAENWKRPQEEIDTLMDLLKEYIAKELDNIHQNNIRFSTIGRIDELPDSVKEALSTAKKHTQNNTGTKLVVALNYSGRLELVDSFNSLLEKKTEHPVSEKDIDSLLYTVGLPNPDLLIRTSGEMRISNFLLWQIAYTEIFVTEVLWPDFRERDLLKAILEFQKRERRYGDIQTVTCENIR